MRISDWSSDVCSSDLTPPVALPSPRLLAWTARPRGIRNEADRPRTTSRARPPPQRARRGHARDEPRVRSAAGAPRQPAAARPLGLSRRQGEIGRAHVCTPVTNAHLVCRLLLEKKKNTT